MRMCSYVGVAEMKAKREKLLIAEVNAPNGIGVSFGVSSATDSRHHHHHRGYYHQHYHHHEVMPPQRRRMFIRHYPHIPIIIIINRPKTWRMKINIQYLFICTCVCLWISVFVCVLCVCVYLYACKLMNVSAPSAVTCGLQTNQRLASLANIAYS